MAILLLKKSKFVVIALAILILNLIPSPQLFKLVMGRNEEIGIKSLKRLLQTFSIAKAIATNLPNYPIKLV